MNEYQQLQAIYEGGWGGLSRDTAPNDRFTADFDSKNSYRGSLPFSSGGSDNLFARMATNTRVTPIESEEEVYNDTIVKSVVINKINLLIDEAKLNEMAYCIHTLSTLLKFVKSN